MRVTIDVPDAVMERLTADGREPTRVALEALLVSAYRAGQVTEGQMKKLLGYGTRMQVHALLAQYGVPLHYTHEHLQLDIDASDKLHTQRQKATRAA